MTRFDFRADELPSPEAIAELYDAAHLRRPTSDLDRLKRMFQGSNVVLTCWDDEPDAPRLAGLLRGWTDYAFDGYVCDLAVHPEYHKRGIGEELLKRAQSIGAPEVQWILLASVIAKDYYAHLGWEAITNGWKWSRTSFEPSVNGGTA